MGSSNTDFNDREKSKGGLGSHRTGDFVTDSWRERGASMLVAPERLSDGEPLGDLLNYQPLGRVGEKSPAQISIKPEHEGREKRFWDEHEVPNAPTAARDGAATLRKILVVKVACAA